MKIIIIEDKQLSEREKDKMEYMYQANYEDIFHRRQRNYQKLSRIYFSKCTLMKFSFFEFVLPPFQ
jgi:hypothetical protein